jgi:hypothetical protein
MNNDASFQRLAAITSLLATLLACGSIGVQAVVLGVTAEYAPLVCANRKHNFSKKNGL